MGIGVAFEFFGIFLVKFWIPGSGKKQFKFDKICLWGNRTAVWGKICGQNPQRGTKEVFKCNTSAGTPLPALSG